MRRITLGTDILDSWSSAEAYVERQRHFAWHATFNAAISAGDRSWFDAAIAACSVHGKVKWFGTDEDVI